LPWNALKISGPVQAVGVHDPAAAPRVKVQAVGGVLPARCNEGCLHGQGICLSAVWALSRLNEVEIARICAFDLGTPLGDGKMDAECLPSSSSPTCDGKGRSPPAVSMRRALHACPCCLLLLPTQLPLLLQQQRLQAWCQATQVGQTWEGVELLLLRFLLLRCNPFASAALGSSLGLGGRWFTADHPVLGRVVEWGARQGKGRLSTLRGGVRVKGGCVQAVL